MAYEPMERSFYPPEGFDSVVAMTQSAVPSGCVDLPEAVIYAEGQSLPEYFVHYRHPDDYICVLCDYVR